MISIVIVLCILVVGSEQQMKIPSVEISNTEILSSTDAVGVIVNGKLNDIYNDTIYNQVLNCQNGYLTLINNANGSQIIFVHNQLGINASNTMVTIEPNQQPSPTLNPQDFTPTTFTLSFNCPSSQIDSNNFYNKVDIHLLDYNYKISFLLDCDPEHRHKMFEYGYLILAALDACILLGVALHSQVWSLRLNSRRLSIPIRWPYVLGICLIALVGSIVLYFIAFKDFQTAFIGIHYFGIVFSTFFVFICFNQILYPLKILRISLYRKVRICELLSALITIAITITAFFVDNWIFYDLISICICVASIKIFHFDSLKEAYISHLIVVLIFGVVTALLHFLEPDRSYNDYASELSSPVFIVVPDLVNNIFKKCSWLFILDIILPGVLLSYLRLYDVNRGSKNLGVYTLSGNLTVVVATILWITLEYAYTLGSIPFSLVTYFSLMLVIFIMSYTRNEWKDLWTGRFQKQNSVLDSSKLTQNHQSISNLIGNDVIDPLKQHLSVSVDDKGSGSHNSGIK